MFRCDWSAYSASIPFRRFDQKPLIRLFEVKYFTPSKYLQRLTEEIAKASGDRGVVKYLAAPPKSGKTCSVLPAFIESRTLPRERQ
jgi:hypothetical protein